MTTLPLAFSAPNPVQSFKRFDAPHFHQVSHAVRRTDEAKQSGLSLSLVGDRVAVECP